MAVAASRKSATAASRAGDASACAGNATSWGRLPDTEASQSPIPPRREFSGSSRLHLLTEPPVAKVPTTRSPPTSSAASTTWSGCSCTTPETSNSIPSLCAAWWKWSRTMLRRRLRARRSPRTTMLLLMPRTIWGRSWRTAPSSRWRTTLPVCCLCLSVVEALY